MWGICAHTAILIVHYAVKIVDNVWMAKTLQNCGLLPQCTCVSTLFTYHSLDRHKRAMEAGLVDLHMYGAMKGCTA